MKVIRVIALLLAILFGGDALILLFLSLCMATTHGYLEEAFDAFMIVLPLLVISGVCFIIHFSIKRPLEDIARTKAEDCIHRAYLYATNNMFNELRSLLDPYSDITDELLYTIMQECVYTENRLRVDITDVKMVKHRVTISRVSNESVEAFYARLEVEKAKLKALGDKNKTTYAVVSATENCQILESAHPIIAEVEGWFRINGSSYRMPEKRYMTVRQIEPRGKCKIISTRKD